MNEPLGILELEAETDSPIWFINHFLETTSSNYLKVVSLREICQRFIEGAEDNDFVIASSSFELLPKNQTLYYDREEVVVLESKRNSAEEFWRLFRHLHRPIVLFQNRPVFDLHSSAALKIRKLTLNSPLGVDLQGNADALADLVRGRSLAARDNDHIAKAIGNVRAIVETSHLIEDDKTPIGVKQFAKDQLESLMNKQDQVNRKLGLRHASIRRISKS